MKELSKSIHRRLRDPGFTTRYFSGDCIDIGGAPDPLALYAELFPLINTVRTWDRSDGNAQFMSGVADNLYDCVHSSHCLEHIEDPAEALHNWFRILAPGGFMTLTVPDEDLYEQGVEGFHFNRDHKWTFTIFKRNSWSRRSRNIVELLTELGPQAQIISLRLEDSGYRYGLPKFDQTRTPVAESSIEIVVRKRLVDEVHARGRLPRNSEFPAHLGIHFEQYVLDQRAAASAHPNPFN